MIDAMVRLEKVLKPHIGRVTDLGRSLRSRPARSGLRIGMRSLDWDLQVQVVKLLHLRDVV
jgi:hypothetical protein